MPTLLDRLGRFSARRHWLVIAAWIAFGAGLLLAGRAAGGGFTDDYRVPGVESQKAADLLADQFPALAGGDATMVFHVRSGTLRDPSTGRAVAAVLAEVARQPHVAAVEQPLTPGGGGAVSADGRTALAAVRYDVRAEEAGRAAFDRLEAAAGRARVAGVTVELGGQLTDLVNQPPNGPAELVGILAALAILLVTFGSVVAAALPIATALVGLLGGTAAVLLAGAAVDIPTAAPVLAVMLGLGAGIDYALFVIGRFRQALAEGAAVPEAAGRATATAGHAVVFAGGTVITAILGLWLAGIPFVGTMGLAAAIMVAVAVLAAVTLLPALLGLAGRRVDALRLPSRWRRRTGRAAGASAGGIAAGGTPAGGGRWAAWARHVDRRPWRYTIGATLILLTLAAPVAAMRLGMTDAGTMPAQMTQRRAYDLVAAGFGPGYNGPLLLAVEPLALAGGRADQAALDRIARAVAADPGVAAVGEPIRSAPAGAAPGGVAVIPVVPTTSPQDQATVELVHRLRDRVLPGATAATGVQVHVGGATAALIDLADRSAERLPLFVLAVVGISFLLLVALFRSVLVPLKAALLNLLSIGAAYGAIVAVFQWGWGRDLVGVGTAVPIYPFVPLIMFAILFGLSMDYEVFLMSRVREAYLATGDSHKAVVTGLAATGRVITSAALIMVCVFLAFVANADPLVKMVGLGLAVAVALDATVIRVVLVPALMSLLGHRNWWLPAWLDRLLPGGPAGRPPVGMSLPGLARAQEERAGVEADQAEAAPERPAASVAGGDR